MSEDAQSIFISWPIENDSSNSVSLQTAICALAGAILDLQTETRELKGQLAELATTTQTMQQTFVKIAEEFHSTTMQARALMSSKPSGVH
jgi:hypothetical protein